MLENTIKKEILEAMVHNEVYGIEVEEAMYELYNVDLYIIGTHKAKEFVKENIDEVLEALEQYENQIGEQYPHVTDYEKLASLTALMIAENIWYNLDTVQDNPGCFIYEDITHSIIDELQENLR